KIEIGLISLERICPGPPVQALVLVVARSRHPGTEPRGARVVVEQAAPGLHAQVLAAGHVGVAEVAVQQMKQRAGGFDLGQDEAGIARPGLGGRVANRVWDALITEAGEPKARTARRRCLEPATNRVRAIVQDLVVIGGVGCSPDRRACCVKTSVPLSPSMY